MYHFILAAKVTKEEIRVGAGPIKGLRQSLSDETIAKMREAFARSIKENGPYINKAVVVAAKASGASKGSVQKYCKDLKPEWVRGTRKGDRLAKTKRQWDTKRRNGAKALMKEARKEKEKLGQINSDLMATNAKEAATAHKMRNRVVEVCEELGHDPIRELVLRAKKNTGPGIKASEIISINKYLVDKLVPNVKSIDIQQNTKLSVSVTVKKFGASDTKAIDIEAMRKAATAGMPSDEEYAGFFENKDDDE